MQYEGYVCPINFARLEQCTWWFCSNRLQTAMTIPSAGFDSCANFFEKDVCGGEYFRPGKAHLVNPKFGLRCPTQKLLVFDVNIFYISLAKDRFRNLEYGHSNQL